MSNDFHGEVKTGLSKSPDLITYRNPGENNKPGIKNSLNKDKLTDYTHETHPMPEILPGAYNNAGFIESSTDKLPEFRIADKEIKSFADLISVIETVPDLSLKYLLSGVLERWAVQFNTGLARDIISIKNSSYDDTEKLSALLFLFDPSRPCRVEECRFSPYNFGPYTFSEPDDFLELLRNEPEQMVEMLFMVPAYLRPDFYPWIDIHYMKLSFLLGKLRDKINKGLVPDLVEELNVIYISLSGDSIRPFKNSTYELYGIKDIINIPEHDRYRVIDGLKQHNSVLYLWLFSENRMSHVKGQWESMDKTWHNLMALINSDHSS